MAVLGLGLAALGRPGYMTLQHSGDLPSTEPRAMELHAHEVFDAAYAGGVRHFDAARSYGKSENFLASWLDARGHRDVFISSKWGYRYTAGWRTDAEVHEVKDHSLSHLESQWAESRALLGARLHVYQVHSATLESGVLKDRAVLDTLSSLGVPVGLSVTGPRQGDVIDAAMETGVFTWVQATWNVLETSAGPALARAKARGAHTIAKEGMANGLLSSRGDVVGWKEFAHEQATTPDALALGIALQQPFLDVVLSGAATVAQLESNLRARNVGAVDGWEAFSVPPERYWAERSKLRWT